MRRHYSTGEQPNHSNGVPAMRPKSATLPAGWSTEVDNESGQTFYYNNQTNKSTWRPPSTSSQSQNDNVCLLILFNQLVKTFVNPLNIIV